MIFSFIMWSVQEKKKVMVIFHTDIPEGIRIGDGPLDCMTSKVPESFTIFWLLSHSSKNNKYKKQVKEYRKQGK